MKFLIFSITFCFCSLISFSQKNVFITLSPKIAGSDLIIGSDFTDLAGVVFNLEYFDYYLSELHIIHDGGQDLDLSDSVYLIEPTNYVLYLGFLNVTNIEQINFGVGVPSRLNTQDGVNAVDISVYPSGHPLSFQDPSMYWGWTTGYFHSILGGLADSDMNGVPDAVFQLHNVENEIYTTLQLPVIQTQTSISQIDVFVNCNIDVWLKDIAIETVGILHGSFHENADMMLNIITETVFNQNVNAFISNPSIEIGTISFLTENSILSISWENMKNVGYYEMIENSGRKVGTGIVIDEKGNLLFNNINSGIYQFTFYDENSHKLNSIKISM